MTKPRWNSSANVASKATLTPVTRTTVPPRTRARPTVPTRAVQGAPLTARVPPQAAAPTPRTRARPTVPTRAVQGAPLTARVPPQAAAPTPRTPARVRPTTETRPVVPATPLPRSLPAAAQQESRIAALEAQLAAVTTESNARQTRILELETSLATVTTERKFYEARSTQHFDTICHLKSVQESEVGRLGADLKALQLDHNILVAAKDEQIAELMTTVKILEKQLESATAASDASKNDLQQLQAQCTAIEQHASTTTVALDQLQALYDASIATNRTLVSQKMILNEQLGMSHADCEAKDLQIHAMAAKDHAKDKQVARLEDNVQLLISLEQDRMAYGDDDDDDEDMVHEEVAPCAYLDPNYEAQPPAYMDMDDPWISDDYAVL